MAVRPAVIGRFVPVYPEYRSLGGGERGQNVHVFITAVLYPMDYISTPSVLA